jgi:hypothetical protein
MSTITEELQMTARDITRGPSFRENVEIAIVGGLLGAAYGYYEGRSKEAAWDKAKAGALIGIGAQYLIFHMLKPAMSGFGRAARSASFYGGHRPMVGVGFHPGLARGGHFEHFGQMLQRPGYGWEGNQQMSGGCPPGTVFDGIAACVPAIPGGF